jgi:hypothetical protein
VPRPAASGAGVRGSAGGGAAGIAVVACVAGRRAGDWFLEASRGVGAVGKGAGVGNPQAWEREFREWWGFWVPRFRAALPVLPG